MLLFWLFKILKNLQNLKILKKFSESIFPCMYIVSISYSAKPDFIKADFSPSRFTPSCCLLEPLKRSPTYIHIYICTYVADWSRHLLQKQKTRVRVSPGYKIFWASHITLQHMYLIVICSLFRKVSVCTCINKWKKSGTNVTVPPGYKIFWASCIKFINS
jgi:hypothetical protein